VLDLFAKARELCGGTSRTNRTEEALFRGGDFHESRLVGEQGAGELAE
jgi:hypothetical protein